MSHILDVYQLTDSYKYSYQEYDGGAIVKCEPTEASSGDYLQNQSSFGEDTKIIIEEFIDENGENWPRADLAKSCVNKEFSACEESYLRDNELPNETTLLIHDQENYIKALIPKEESESRDIEENRTVMNNFIVNEESICNNDTWKCTNEKFVKDEENDSSDDPLTDESKVLVDDQEDFINAFIPKEESESMDIEENKIIMNNSINHDEISCNNDIAEWNTHSIESKNTDDFAAENAKLEAENFGGEQIVDSVVDLKLKKYECLFCNYSAVLKTNLRKHIYSVHLKLKNHKCYLCDYVASRKSLIQSHVESVHLKLKNHKCNLCDYIATQKRLIKSHINSVHLKLKNYECHLCDYIASRKYKIQLHVESVHLKLRKHKCHLCDYSASQKRNLEQHINYVHLKLQYHKCHLCDYTATHRRLQLHIDSVHLKLKNYKCHKCDYNASRKMYLQKHINSVHLKLKNHKCRL